MDWECVYFAEKYLCWRTCIFWVSSERWRLQVDKVSQTACQGWQLRRVSQSLLGSFSQCSSFLHSLTSPRSQQTVGALYSAAVPHITSLHSCLTIPYVKPHFLESVQWIMALGHFRSTEGEPPLWLLIVTQTLVLFSSFMLVCWLSGTFWSLYLTTPFSTFKWKFSLCCVTVWVCDCFFWLAASDAVFCRDWLLISLSLISADERRREHLN